MCLACPNIISISIYYYLKNKAINDMIKQLKTCKSTCMNTNDFLACNSAYMHSSNKNISPLYNSGIHIYAHHLIYIVPCICSIHKTFLILEYLFIEVKSKLNVLTLQCDLSMSRIHQVSTIYLEDYLSKSPERAPAFFCDILTGPWWCWNSPEPFGYQPNHTN